MSNDKGYNGYANYETWCVSLWIDNDQEAHYYVANLAKNALDATPEYSFQTVEQAQRRALEESLREFVECDMIPDLGASLASDLLGAAMSEVDWSELAELYLEQAREAMQDA